jgi:hypothetical protein
MTQLHRIHARPRIELTAVGPHFAPAEVILVERDIVVVSFGVQQAEARLAVLDYEPAVGDQVLVIGNDVAGYYAIGVLATVHARPKLKIESSENSNATIVTVENGDLEFVAPRGAVRIISSAGLDATTMGPIELKSRVAVGASIVDRVSQTIRRFSLTRRSAELRHEQVEVDADRLQVAARDGSLKADDAAVNLGSLSLVARRISSELGSLLSHVENAFHQVAGLWQLAAKRTRMVVDETSHHKAQRIYSKADDVKVKANKIHLG